MKIKVEWLKEQNACEDGMVWFGKKDRDAKTVFKALLKADRFEWANWAIARLLDRPNKIRYAVFAAEQVIEIYEKEYPDDKRPRQAIEAAKAVLKDDTPENRNATFAAYDAANTTYAAYATGNTAYAAYAAYATYAIANTTYADYDAVNTTFAAYDAVNAIVNAADKKKMQIKILKYGLKLLEKKGGAA